jgi:hypothetical protein
LEELRKHDRARGATPTERPSGLRRGCMGVGCRGGAQGVWRAHDNDERGETFGRAGFSLLSGKTPRRTFLPCRSGRRSRPRRWRRRRWGRRQWRSGCCGASYLRLCGGRGGGCRRRRTREDKRLRRGADRVTFFWVGFKSYLNSLFSYTGIG